MTKSPPTPPGPPRACERLVAMANEAGGKDNATAIVARLGPVALGGQQVAYRLWYMLSLSLDALAVPAQVYVSAAVGAADPDTARRIDPQQTCQTLRRAERHRNLM